MKTEYITEHHLNWALCHLERFGGSDVFPPNQDYFAIRADWDAVKAYLLELLKRDYSPGVPYLGLCPKADDTFRAVHELNPLDSLIITAVIYAISGFIENARIPEEQGVIFSYRLSPNHDGRFFKEGSDNWGDFAQKRDALFAQFANGWVLKADIADFYNQIYIHRVKNALEECLPAEMVSIATFVHDFLLGLNATISRGIPVGPAFSTVLAEAVLNDVDHRIAGYGVKFVRWVDDIYIFHDQEWGLYNIQNQLTEYLYSTHRLVFNGSKTKLCRVSEMRDFLDGMENQVVQAHVRKLKDRKCAELLDDLIKEQNPYDSSEIDWDKLTQVVEKKYEDKEAFRTVSSAYLSIIQHAVQTRNMTLAKHVLKICTAARIRSIYPVVKENIRTLLPLIREVAFYIRRSCSNENILEFCDSVIALVRLTKNKHTLRWLGFILTFPEYPPGHNIDEDVYLAFELRDRLLIAMETRDYYRIKALRTQIEQLPDLDRRAFIYATSALTRDERNPILSHVEKRERILDSAYAKYVRNGVKSRRE